ncbi:MAG: tetratricopeptide repeat protein [Planctomycetota bacterium]
MRALAVVAFAALLISLGCQGPRPTLKSPESTAVVFDDLGTFRRSITTDSLEAQRWFDQGLNLIYGFNHEEAIRSFEEALRWDPDCAMAYWGQSLASGPNINNAEMEAAANQRAFEAIEKALALRERVSPIERALIEAVAERYEATLPEDRAPLDRAYADAMRKVHGQFPGDTDVTTLYAEALMDLRPWDLWTPEGLMQPGTDEIIALLESVLEVQPNHPGANHYYIHTMEASPMPEKALAAADRLRDLVPDAGHLVHMPAHIYQRVGRYQDAVLANQKAVAADNRYMARTKEDGFYALYRAHNYHFLAWSAMFEGRSGIALEAARDLVASIPIETVEAFPDFLDGFMAAPLHVLVRFGRWDDLLLEPQPKSTLPVTTAFWHYARGVAYAVPGDVLKAEAELAAFEAALEDVPGSARIGNNSAKSVLAIARAMLHGELLFRKGDLDEAFERIEEAVRLDDLLRYDEPWGWMQPARHSLGALLVQAERYEDAIPVYREDLRKNPENGWSLHGLAECLRRTGQIEEATEVEARFQKAWQRADVVLPGSCYCRTSVPVGG